MKNTPNRIPVITSLPSGWIRTMHIKSMSPLAKLGIWLGMTCCLAAVAQLAAWAIRLDFNVLHSSGLLLAMALASLYAAFV